jgi:hypothetical protein
VNGTFATQHDARLGKRVMETLATMPSVMTGIWYLSLSFEIQNIIQSLLSLKLLFSYCIATKFHFFIVSDSRISIKPGFYE